MGRFRISPVWSVALARGHVRAISLGQRRAGRIRRLGSNAPQRSNLGAELLPPGATERSTTHVPARDASPTLSGELASLYEIGLNRSAALRPES